MSSAVRKLKSNSGATLMLALLFFVVCAVTGAMVLLSGTAAAGRLIGMKTSDQNYYAVRSAAKFVEKQLQQEYITAEEKVRKHEETKTVTDEETREDREITVTTYTYTPPVFKKGVAELPDISSSDSGIILYMLMDDNISYFSKKHSYDGSDSETYPSEFNLNWFKEKDTDDGTTGRCSVGDADDGINITVSEGSTELEDMAVNMTAEMDSTGVLTLTFINKEDDDSEKNNKYSIVLKMQCNKSREYKEETEDGDAVKIRTYKFTFDTVSMEKG